MFFYLNDDAHQENSISWGKTQKYYQKKKKNSYIVLKLVYDSVSIDSWISILFSFDDEKDLKGSYPNSLSAGPPYVWIDFDRASSDDS